MLGTLLMIVIAFALLVALPCAADRTRSSHAFTVHDLMGMDRIGVLKVSPDGTRVVFEKRVVDLKENKAKPDLWLIRSGGQGLRRLTSHEKGSMSPQWSPDGESILFLSARGGSSQVWRIATDGGEAVQITDQPLDVSAFRLAPDGLALVIAMDVFSGKNPDSTKEELDAPKEEDKPSGQIFDRLFIRHWDTWKDGRRSHLFALPVDGGEPKDLMPDADFDVPDKPFGGVEDFVFTPDGKSVVFCAADTGKAAAWSTRHNLYVVPVDGSAPPKCITPDNEAWLANPAFSPNGKTLAYRAMARAKYEADRFRIILMDWPSGQHRVLTEDWDRSAGAPVWSKDGKTIYTAADHFGQHALFAVNVATGDVTTVVDQGKVTTQAVTSDGIVFGLCHHKSPVDLFTAKLEGSDRQQITRVNEEKLASIRMGESEQFSFAGWNDEEVYAYVVKPVDFEESKKYPVAFLIHGGPQGSFGSDFHYRWNPQTYAGAGYAAIMVDFHGSTGYGQAFVDSIGGDWGGKPFEDLQKGLAAALDRYSWMDGDRVAALGASFGGYMINWIAGQWPDRFRCLVNHDGNLDERIAYFDTEELWFPEWDHRGVPWENPESYEKHNPINHVDKWKTPMLVIHGAKDYRVVDTQGISTFTALQRRGIPSKFLYFPDENHWVLKPRNSIQWHETVIGWLDEWTKE